MSARRQSSSTSLSKYARANSPDLANGNRSLDFCNAFWGLGDGGVDVLFARMRGASRTTTELRNYWKERSAIEEDYAKRMSKLAKTALGKDEIGELRNSLDTLRLETDKAASYHQTLSKQIRDDLESGTANFIARQTHSKKTFQAAIEKKFKTKQQQEYHVAQAAEKYKADCLRINSYTAQSSLMQGKELEKIQIKLERAQQTVQANERDYANFARVLGTTVAEWEQDWKAFCDHAQDMEDDRIEFMKDSMWAYANAVSTVCVSDDESCEHVRVALEQMEPEKDMENFVRDYGTGNLVPDPPQFINYNSADSVPSGSQRITTRPATFPRSSQRTMPPRQPPPPLAPEVDEDTLENNTAGVGAGRGASRQGTAESMGGQSETMMVMGGAPPTRSQSQSRGSIRGNNSQPNGNGAPNGQGQGGSSQALSRRSTTRAATAQSQSQGSFRPPNDPTAEPIDPTAETMLKVGNNVYKVDPTNDPQSGSSLNGRSGPSPVPNAVGGVGAANDPLAQKMNELRAAASAGVSGDGSSVSKRNSTYRNGSTDSRATAGAGAGTGASTGASRRGTTKGSALSPPSSSSAAISPSSPSRDYRNSAEFVVGTYPGTASSRPASPNPPTAAHMQPPNRGVSPALADKPIDSVLADYHQSFPKEGKSISRSNSRQGSFSAPAPAPTHNPNNMSHGKNLARPVSRDGHAGIGAHGSRSPSPAPQSIQTQTQGPGPNRRNSQQPIPPSSASVLGSASSKGGGSISQGTTSPNSVGIALDPSGKVAVDSMADMYRQQQPSRQQTQPPPQQQVPPPPQPQYVAPPPPSVNNNLSRAGSYAGNSAPVTQQPSYAPQGQQGPPSSYGQQQQQPQTRQPQYTQQPQYAQQPQYTQAPPSHYPPPPVQQQAPPQQLYQPQPQAGNYTGPGMNGAYGNQNQPSMMSAPSHPYGNGGRSPSPQPPPQQQQQQQQQQQALPPTGQFTEDGRGVLFYVKALYDYVATIEEEFDFQSGDIIAVTSTPEDGWWSGELLDEARRQPGRHVFPSNFVCLF